MMRIYVVTACWVAMAAAAFGQQLSSGTIGGFVTDATGAPISGAVVLYNNVPNVTRDSMGRIVLLQLTVSSGVLSAPDGSFAINGLPDGQYLLCAYGVQPSQLSTCAWGAPSQSVTITGGAAVNGVNFQLSLGTVLVISVNDPNGVIVDTASGPLVNGLMPLFGGNFRIGVMLGLNYAQAQFSSQAGTVRNYTVTVSSNVTMSLFADTQLQLSTQSGATIPSDTPSISIAVGSAATQTVQLQVM